MFEDVKNVFVTTLLLTSTSAGMCHYTLLSIIVFYNVFFSHHDLPQCTVTVSATPLPEDMKELLDQTTFSDVYFVVEGRRVFAHKAILAARSVYFNTLLSNTSLNFCSVEVNAF